MIVRQFLRKSIVSAAPRRFDAVGHRQDRIPFERDLELVVVEQDFGLAKRIDRSKGYVRDREPPRKALARVGQIHVEPREERRSEEHTSELQSLMRISSAVFCLDKTKNP